MHIIDHIRFGPFSTQYHTALANADFKASLSSFLANELLCQLDEPADDSDGTLIATFDNDHYCGPSSLVRNIFTLEIILIGRGGNSELKSEIEFHPETKTFSQRTGRRHDFYLWTPVRKRNREAEIEMIQRLIDDFQRTHSVGLKCPICQGNVIGIDDPSIINVRCTDKRCFAYNYHKDENGRLTHGHFFTYHPKIWA